MTGDAGFGYDIFLSAIYDIEARRVVDTRTHETDEDHDSWTMRGYDDKGRPVCEFGYPLTANGYDSARQRKKWFCQGPPWRKHSLGAFPSWPGRFAAWPVAARLQWGPDTLAALF